MTTARSWWRAYRIIARVSSIVRNVKTPWWKPRAGECMPLIAGTNGLLPVAMMSLS